MSQFNFKPAKKEELKIVINASMGHRNWCMLSQTAQLKEKAISPREVIGGIGYIFGIAGIAFWFLSKKKK